MSALLESLIAQSQRCRRGEYVCTYPCKRCDRYREWCQRNNKAVNR